MTEEIKRYKVVSGEVRYGRVVEVFFNTSDTAKAYALTTTYPASVWVGYELKRRDATAWRLLYFKKKYSNQLIKY